MNPFQPGDRVRTALTTALLSPDRDYEVVSVDNSTIHVLIPSHGTVCYHHSRFYHSGIEVGDLVECIDNTDASYITVGRYYQVTSLGRTVFGITADDGVGRRYYRTHFIPVRQHPAEAAAAAAEAAAQECAAAAHPTWTRSRDSLPEQGDYPILLVAAGSGTVHIVRGGTTPSLPFHWMPVPALPRVPTIDIDGTTYTMEHHSDDTITLRPA